MSVILLVEDEEQVRVLAESFLQTDGHTTLSAGSSEQALALLGSSDPIDLLFIDLKLQGDNEAGLSLAAKGDAAWFEGALYLGARRHRWNDRALCGEFCVPTKAVHS